MSFWNFKSKEDLVNNMFSLSKKVASKFQTMSESLLAETKIVFNELVDEVKHEATDYSKYLPWVTTPNLTPLEIENYQKSVLLISQEGNNFTVNAPEDFKLDGGNYGNRAVALINFDDNLRDMRYKFVPKILSETAFWTNYFYRLSLVEKAVQIEISSREQPPPCDKPLLTVVVGEEIGSISKPSSSCGSFSVIGTETTENADKDENIDDVIELSDTEDVDMDEEVRKELEREGLL